MSNTKLQVRNKMYEYLAETEVSQQYTPATLDSLINDLQRRICTGSLVKFYSETSETVQTKRMPFLEKRMPIVQYAPSTVNGAGALAGDVTIPMTDTTGLTASGTVYARGNIIYYTAKTLTSLTGVTNLLIDLPVGTQVQQIYPINNVNIYKPFQLSIQWGQQTIPCQKWDPGTIQPPAYYTILNDGDSRFLFINYYPTYRSGIYGTYWLDYILVPPLLVQDTDILTLPDDQGINTLAPIGVGELLWKTEEIDFSREKGVIGFNSLVQFYKGLNPQIQDMIQTIPYNFNTAASTIGPNSVLTPSWPYIP